MRTALENNSLSHLHRTVMILSDGERQRSYKNAVPFVHVPNELLEQWSGYRRLLREQAWFGALFTAQQLTLLDDFDALVKSRSLKLGRRLPDVPEILERPPWTDIARAAASLLPSLPALQ